MTPEDRKKRTEIERKWEDYDSGRAEFMKKMRWGECRMATHERHCQEHLGDCSISVFILAWLITLATFFLLPYESHKILKAIQWVLFVYLVIPILPCGFANFFVWLRKLFYKHFLKLPDFLPTRPWEEPAETESTRRLVEEAAKQTRSALYDAKKHSHTCFTNIANAKRVAEEEALEFLKGVEQQASDWQVELRRRCPAVARRTRKEQARQASLAAAWYKKYAAYKSETEKLQASWEDPVGQAPVAATPPAPALVAAPPILAAPNKGALGTVLTRGSIVPRMEPDTPKATVVPEAYIPLASFQFNELPETEPTPGTDDARFAPPPGFRIRVEPVPELEQKPATEPKPTYVTADARFAPPADSSIQVEPVSELELEPTTEPEPELVTIFEPDPEPMPKLVEPDPVFMHEPEPAPTEPELASEPELVFEAVAEPLRVPPPSLTESPREPETDEWEPARSTRTRTSRAKPEPEYAPEPAIEGGRKLRTNYAVVRNPKLRAMAIQIHGRSCCVCSFNFDAFFGEELARGYIEIHHLNKIADGERSTDPATDLAPLCANCHAMADRLTLNLAIPPATIADLKRLLIPGRADPSP